MGMAIALRRRRLLVGLAISIIAYLFIKHLPTDVPSVADRYDARTGAYLGRYVPNKSSKETSLPNSEPLRYDMSHGDLYDGPVRFDGLAFSLRANMYTSGQDKDNVVFILNNLNTASKILPLACDMAAKHRNIVHLAIMSLSDASVDEIMQVNGAARMDCPLHVHDARPDHNLNSSPARRAIAVKSAIGYIGGALLPKLIFTDTKHAEDPIFYDALRGKAESLRIPVQALISNAGALDWIKNLRASSLLQLPAIDINILIQVSTESAGSLSALLQSIYDANYADLTLPTIIIELPANVDSFVFDSLRDFTWPPERSESGSKIIVRRQLKSNPSTAGSDTLHILESFYPASASESHVLVLSSDVQLSSNYFLYLIYMLLEYKYTPIRSSVPDRLFGISLELPEQSLNGRNPLYKGEDKIDGPVILSQRPASNAVLYFGDKWIEFHQFLTQRLEHDPDLSKTVEAHHNDIAKGHPLWLRQALEYMRALGLYVMYPAFATDERFRLASVQHGSGHKDQKAVQTDENDSLKDVENEHQLRQKAPMSEVEPLQSLLDHLFGESHAALGFLPKEAEMPLFSFEGTLVGRGEFQTRTTSFADEFSVMLGGCSSADERRAETYESIDSLFCDPD